MSEPQSTEDMIGRTFDTLVGCLVVVAAVYLLVEWNTYVWRQAAVQHGAAEWRVGDDGKRTWHWKDEPKGEEASQP